MYRGTAATRAIQRYTLISSSKAAVFCRQRDHGHLDFNIDPYSKFTLRGSQAELENKLVMLLYRRPKLRGNIYALSSGLGHPDVNDGGRALKIDSKQIYGTVANNSFTVMTEEEIKVSWKQYVSFQTG